MEHKKTGSGDRGANKIGSFRSDKNKSRHFHPAQPSFYQKESIKGSSREEKPEKLEPEVKAPHKPTGWIGTDESGKGVYFGPLVVVGVYLEDKLLPPLRQLNVRDNKKISDGVIKDLDFRLRSICRYSVVVIGREKYNLLYQGKGQRNRVRFIDRLRHRETVCGEYHGVQ